MGHHTQRVPYLLAVLVLGFGRFVAGSGTAQDHELKTITRVDASPADVIAVVSWQFERCREWFPTYRTSFPQRIDLLHSTSWYCGELRRRVPDCALFEPFNNSTVRTRWADLGGHRFYFISTLTESIPSVHDENGVWKAPPRHFQTLAFIEDEGESRQSLVLNNVENDPYLRWLEFDIVPFDDALVLVYGAMDGVYQKLGRLEDGVLKFGPPQRIHARGPGIHNLQLARTEAALHAAWAVADGDVGSMFYARCDGLAAGWIASREVSKSAHRRSVHMLAEGEDVYLCWSDRRFETHPRLFEQKNSAKLIICRSEDGGKTFLDPVLLHDRDDTSQNTSLIRLIPAPGAIVLLWPVESYIWPVEAWHIAYLDHELQRLAIDDDVITEKELRSAAAARVRAQVNWIDQEP